MRIENLLFSAVQFFLVLVVSCMGLFFIALPWAPQVRFKCAAFLSQHDGFFIPLGAFFLVVGAALGVGFYFLQKRSYFQVRMSPSVYIEKEVLKGLLENYWKTRFPESKLKTDVVLHRDKKIELVAELPSLNAPEKALKEIELEVGKLLVQQLGYKREFFFTFQLK